MTDTVKTSWFTRGLDRAIASFAPGRALRRKAERHQLHNFSASYRGASTGRTRWGNRPQSGTGDSHLSSTDIDSLRSQHHDFDRNNCIFSGIITRFIDNIIGPGFNFQMKTGDKGLNAAVEERYLEWSKKEADYRGIMSFWEMQRLALREVLNGGDMFFAKVSGQLQPIEPDLVVDPLGKTIANAVNNGIETNAAGQIVKYHVGKWASYGGVSATDTTPVDPSEIVSHIFIPKRFSLGRGVPIFSGALEMFERLDDYVEATQIAAQVGACQGMAVYSEQGAAFGLGQSSESDDADDDTRHEEMKGGRVYYLKDTDKVENIKPEQPTDQFAPFIKTLIRFIGLELGMPLELALMDFSGTNYSSAKASLTQSAITSKVWQGTLDCRLLSPVTDWKLPAFFRDVGAQYSPEVAKYIWIPPARKWIDLPREIKAHVSGVSEGVETMQEVAAEQGHFWRDVTAQRGEEIKEAMEVAAAIGGDVTWRDIIPSKDAAQQVENGGENDTEE